MAILNCVSAADSNGRELLEHGSYAFPIGCYHDDLARAEVPWHWHDELEAAVVTGGSAVVAAGDQRHILRAGDAFFINAQVLHGCWDWENSACCFHSMAFHPRLVAGSPDSIFQEKYLQPLLNSRNLAFLHLRRDVPWQARAIDAIEGAWQACAREKAGYEFRVRSALSELILLLRENALPAQEALPARLQRNGERIKKMLGFIQEHCAEALDTRSIAQSAALSESECLRCFRATIGMPPVRYLRQYRIQRAAQMLKSGTERIADIAEKCGFQDVSYFTKTFRQIKGCTPGQYRSREGGEG